MPRVIIILCILPALFLSAGPSCADKIEDEVLNTAEGFFIALKEKRFADAWESLTIKSRDTIVNEVYKEINNTEAKIGKKVVKEEFDKKGELFWFYWEAFIKNFDPDTVLEQSVWNIGKIKADRAIIITRYKKSEYPSELKVYKEKGKWRFGLIESFWTRKR